jgi:hypothetical protein
MNVDLESKMAASAEFADPDENFPDSSINSLLGRNNFNVRVCREIAF